jgi:hypothetical protein
MKTLIVPTLVALLTDAADARADVTEQEAIQAQLAGALASADYATKNCPRLRIDRARIDELLARSGSTEAALRASEDYADQRDTIAALAKDQPKSLICALLPDAHGGYARGVIVEK